MSHKQLCFCGIMTRTRQSAVAAAKKSRKPSCCKKEGKGQVAAAKQSPKKDCCKKKRKGQVAVPVPVMATETDVQKSLERADALNTQDEGCCCFLAPTDAAAESEKKETILDQANKKNLLLEANSLKQFCSLISLIVQRPRMQLQKQLEDS